MIEITAEIRAFIDKAAAGVELAEDEYIDPSDGLIHCKKCGGQRPFIGKVANDLFRSMNLAQSGLNLDTDDLKQAGNLGLWKAVPKFDAARGMKFLTYAAPAIHNAMMDMVRDAFAAFEQRMVTEDKDGILLPACFAG